MQLLFYLYLFTFFVMSPLPEARHPNCSCQGGWPATMAFVYLKNAGITNNYSIDFEKTEITRIASQRLGKNRYRQVHHIFFVKKSGDKIEVITVNDASSTECSLGPLDVFVISRHLGGTG